MRLKTVITVMRNGLEKDVEVTGDYSPPEPGPYFSHPAEWSDVDSDEVTLTPEERERATEELAEEMFRRTDRAMAQAEDAAEARRERL